MNIATFPNVVHQAAAHPQFQGCPDHSTPGRIGGGGVSTLGLVPAGRVLFWQGERQDQQIEVARGVVRAVRLLENGDRQILAFFWPGTIIRPAHAACQYYTAEAVTECRLHWSAPIEGVCSRSDRCGVDQVLQEMLPLVLSIGQKGAVARIAWFLLRIRKHLPRDPLRFEALRLMLPRADIADYLGTSIETVCRTLSDFRARGVIDLPNRKTIQFLDLASLSRLAGQ